MSKDVPMLRHLLGLSESELKVTELIGSNNHYCELLFRQSREEEDLFSADRSFDEQMLSDAKNIYDKTNLLENEMIQLIDTKI